MGFEPKDVPHVWRVESVQVSDSTEAGPTAGRASCHHENGWHATVSWERRAGVVFLKSLDIATSNESIVEHELAQVLERAPITEALLRWFKVRDQTWAYLVQTAGSGEWKPGVPTQPETLAAAARLYELMVTEGNTDVVKNFQQVWGVERATAAKRLQTLRRRGYLTTSTHGVVEGRATEIALQVKIPLGESPWAHG